MRSSWTQGGCDLMTRVPIRDIQERDTQKEEKDGYMKTELCGQKPRKAWSHQKSKEARKESSLETLEGTSLCQPFDFELLKAMAPPLQYSCLENPMDRAAWQAAVHGVAKSQTLLSDFTFTFPFHALEMETATHSSVLAWRIPGKGKPVRLPLWGRTESDMTEVTQQQPSEL